jgi:hypothetical protein
MFRVGLEIEAGDQIPDEGIQPVRLGGPVFGEPGNDQRDAGFIDQNRIRLVHDHGRERPVNAVLGTIGDPVPKKIETRLLGCGVRDVEGVGRPFHSRRLSLLDAPHGQTEKAEYRAHPGRVPPSQIVVKG